VVWKFSAVFSAITDVYNPAQIKQLFASHQAPYIISSLSLWMEFNGGIFAPPLNLDVLVFLVVLKYEEIKC